MRRIIVIFTVTLAVLAGCNSVLAVWQEPCSNNPPECNRPEPVDVSAVGQIKEGQLEVHSTVLVDTIQDALKGVTSGLDKIGVYGENTSGGWAGSFSGYLGAYNLTVGPAGSFVNADYLRDGDAYFYNNVGIGSELRVAPNGLGRLCLNGTAPENCINSWPNAQSLWVDNGSSISPLNASGVNIYDGNAISVCSGMCAMAPFGYNLVSNFNVLDDNSIAVYAYAGGANSYAGYFFGDLGIEGSLSDVNSTDLYVKDQLSIGHPGASGGGVSVGQGENLIYGNAHSGLLGDLILIQVDEVDRFKVDLVGNTEITGSLKLKGSNQACNVSTEGILAYFKACGVDQTTSYLKICMKSDQNSYTWWTLKSYSWQADVCEDDDQL